MLLDEKNSMTLDKFLKVYEYLNDIDETKARTLIAENMKVYQGKIDPANTYAKYLETYWYNALHDHRVDYSVYADEYYFTDTYVCWSLYSKKYLKSIMKSGSLDGTQSVMDYIGEINSIADLGCGVGYSTAALKELYQDADVWGTNIPFTPSWNFCVSQADHYDFSLAPDVTDIRNNKIDLVFASEYFEHIEYPIEHLDDILLHLDPKYLLIANSFNTESVGHFEYYKIAVGGPRHYELIDQKKISRMFNNYLREKGYTKVQTKLWNNKPTLWEKTNA